jgi:signal transduction histidine kinase
MIGNFYKKKSRWKIYLAIVGAIIIGISMFFTLSLAKQLGEEEEKRVKQYIIALESTTQNLADTNQLCDFTLATEILVGNTTIPIIMLDEYNNIVDARNFPNDQDTVHIRRELNTILATGAKPLLVESAFSKQFLYFKQSQILTLLSYFPWLQLLLITAFVVAGYLAFSTARRSEQNQVWVGMAKETAHQLGTPISGILGWIELLRLNAKPEDAMTHEAINELENDVYRLNTVADRFSKIGAAPDLVLTDLNDVLAKNHEYMSKRMPRKVQLVYPASQNDPPVNVLLNAPLFDWVLENLVRNAVDALENGVGKIEISVYKEPTWVCLELTDTGKGIAREQFKTVFQPGFSTKKRGWGLGLSLAKRIIKEYHKGQIFVKKSEIGKGTTFCIKLPI